MRPAGGDTPTAAPPLKLQDNLVISLLAKRRFAVPRVAARVKETWRLHSVPPAREKLPVRLAPPNVRIGVSGLGGTLIGAWRCYGGQRDGAEHSSSSSPDFLGDAVYTDRKTVWTGQALPPLPSCPRGCRQEQLTNAGE